MNTVSVKILKAVVVSGEHKKINDVVNVSEDEAKVLIG